MNIVQNMDSVNKSHSIMKEHASRLRDRVLKRIVKYNACQNVIKCRYYAV